MHPFWVRLRAAMRRGDLRPSDVAAWFAIDYDKAFFWARMHHGHRGPWPMSNQRGWFRLLDQLEMAVNERLFPLACGPRQRRELIGEIRARYHKRVPVGGFTEPRVVSRAGRTKRTFSSETVA